MDTKCNILEDIEKAQGGELMMANMFSLSKNRVGQVKPSQI
jgi:hypothetical protein